MTVLPTAGVGDACSSRRRSAAARLGPHWTLVLASQLAGTPVAMVKVFPMATVELLAAAHEVIPTTTIDRVATW